MSLSRHGPAASPGPGSSYTFPADIDITGQSGFEPSHYLIRAGGSNADEVVISFDGVTDAITIATPTNNGCIHVRVKSRARKVWVRRSGNANATAVALISPSTDI